MIPFRPERNATVDTLRWAKKKHGIPTLLEVDVTGARTAIREARRERGEGLSFTAWVIHCVARAAAEHPRVHALRRGRRKLVLFDEVDVAFLVEKPVDGHADDAPGTDAPRGDDPRSPAHETLPMPAVIRDAARKTPVEIHEAVRRAQDADVDAGASSIEDPTPAWLQSLFFRLPTFLRDLFWRWLLRSPARVKKTMGTVVVTATGMAAPGILAWGIPLALHPLAIGVGGIARRDAADGPRDILALTIVFDHDVVDGAPVGRFIRRLVELMTEPDEL